MEIKTLFLIFEIFNQIIFLNLNKNLKDKFKIELLLYRF